MGRTGWNNYEPDEIKQINERIRKELIRTGKPLPVSYKRRVREVLEQLPDKKETVERWALRKVVAAVLASVLFASTGVVAGVKLYRQRLASMEPQKVEKLDSVTQKQRMGADSYSRDLSETEEERLLKLEEKYKNEGLFPRAELRCADTEEDVSPGGLCYCYEDGTFYLPEGEMGEEELLQIIDFQYKREYSLEIIREGEEVEDQTVDVDISGTEDGKMAAEKGREFLKDLYGWEIQNANCEVKSDGEDYSVTWKRSGQAYDVEIEMSIDTMELRHLSIDDGEKPESGKMKIDVNEYVKYAKQVTKIEKKLKGKEENIKLWMGYHYRKESIPEFGVVKYYLMYKDKSGYVFKYNLNEKMITEIVYMSDVKQVIKTEQDNQVRKYRLKKIY